MSISSSRTDLSSYASAARSTAAPGPQLLVSVRNATEVQLLRGHSIGIVDFKEPNEGSLGRPTDATIESALAALPADQPCSIALGELVDFVRGPSEQSTLKLAERFHFAKIGLAGALALPGWQQHWQRVCGRLPAAVGRVAVAYLDHESCQAPALPAVIDLAISSQATAVLFDTHEKIHGSFADVIPEEALRHAISTARTAGLKTVLAGSVNASNLPLTVEFAPDYIGVRGAVCDGARTSSVTATRLASFCQTFAAIGNHAIDSVRAKKF